MIQIKHNQVKNPNWQEADQLAINKCGLGVELGSTMKQLQVVVRAGLEPGTSGFQVKRPNHSATLPSYNSRIFNPYLNTIYATTRQHTIPPLRCFVKSAKVMP